MEEKIYSMILFKRAHFTMVLFQWRIQDFTDGEGSANSREHCANLLIRKICAEHSTAMKEFGLRGGVHPWCPHGPASELLTILQQ